MLANVHRDREQRPDPFGWRDWFAEHRADTTGPAPNLADKIRAWVRSSAGKVVKVPRK